MKRRRNVEEMQYENWMEWAKEQNEALVVADAFAFLDNPLAKGVGEFVHFGHDAVKSHHLFYRGGKTEYFEAMLNATPAFLDLQFEDVYAKRESLSGSQKTSYEINILYPLFWYKERRAILGDDFIALVKEDLGF